MVTTELSQVQHALAVRIAAVQTSLKKDIADLKRDIGAIEDNLEEVKKLVLKVLEEVR